jgi:two-component system nitrogen regulation sensor histidine kinase NtrY
VLAGEQGPVHLQVVLTSPATAAGSPVLLALFEDVTELVRAQKLAAWRAVARRIAHEIKNPLTPIQLSAQRILKKYRDGAEDLPEALEAGVQTIVAEVGGLKQMVDEFSQFARMPEVRPVAGDLAAMLRSVAALYGGHERLRVELRLPDELPGVAFDPDLLRRAIVNLLDNAVEATGGRGHVVVACEAEADGRGVRITVADDGPGVPRDDREKLFLPYFTTKKRGTGLGLAIVNRIVSDHDGRIRVEANRPRGARFVLTLPLATEGGPAAANPATAAPGRPA